MKTFNMTLRQILEQFEEKDFTLEELKELIGEEHVSPRIYEKNSFGPSGFYLVKTSEGITCFDYYCSDDNETNQKLSKTNVELLNEENVKRFKEIKSQYQKRLNVIKYMPEKMTYSYKTFMEKYNSFRRKTLTAHDMERNYGENSSLYIPYVSETHGVHAMLNLEDGVYMLPFYNECTWMSANIGAIRKFNSEDKRYIEETIKHFKEVIDLTTEVIEEIEHIEKPKPIPTSERIEVDLPKELLFILDEKVHSSGLTRQQWMEIAINQLSNKTIEQTEKEKRKEEMIQAIKKGIYFFKQLNMVERKTATLYFNGLDKWAIKDVLKIDVDEAKRFIEKIESLIEKGEEL